jgi:hypothetical protein
LSDEHHHQPEAKNSTPADRKNIARADHGRRFHDDDDPLLPHRDDDENPIAEFFPDSSSEVQIITTPHAILQQGSTGIDLLDGTTSENSILVHSSEDTAVSDVTASRSSFAVGTGQNKSEETSSSSNSLETRIFGSEPRDNNKSMVPYPSFGGPTTNGPGGSAPTTTTAPGDNSTASRPQEGFISNEQDGFGLIGLPEACPDHSLATDGNGGLAVIGITQPASDDSSPPGVAESCDIEHDREDWNDEDSTQWDVRLDFGKHQGRTYREVALNHPDYGAWALRQSDPSPRLARFCAWYRSHGRDIITDRSTGSSDVGRSHLVENEADMPGTARQLFPAPAIGRGNDRDRLNDNDLVGFGRHSHRTYHEVAVNHADYLSWAVGVSNPSPKLARFCRWYHMNNTNDSTMNRSGVRLDTSFDTPYDHAAASNFDGRVATTTMGFGRYKLLSYGQVAEQDPDYCRWALGEDNPRRALREFRDWLMLSNTI